MNRDLNTYHLLQYTVFSKIDCYLLYKYTLTLLKPTNLWNFQLMSLCHQLENNGNAIQMLIISVILILMWNLGKSLCFNGCFLHIENSEGVGDYYGWIMGLKHGGGHQPTSPPPPPPTVNHPLTPQTMLFLLFHHQLYTKYFINFVIVRKSKLCLRGVFAFSVLGAINISVMFDQF